MRNFKPVPPFLQMFGPTYIIMLEISANNCLDLLYASHACNLFQTMQSSFSKLKLIKNYLHSTMGQDRLTDLGTLAIETDFAQKLNSVDSIIDYFAQQKTKNVHLM